MKLEERRNRIMNFSCLEGVRILVIEHDLRSTQFITSCLYKLRCQILIAHTEADAHELLSSQIIDIILMDVNMPDSDGMIFFKQLKKDINTCMIPIIFMTSRDELQNCIKGLKLGAVDYITKPFYCEELIARINVVMAYKRQTKLLQEKNKKLSELAMTDELTQLYNRRYMIQRLREEIARSKRHRLSLSCLMLDVDYFKEVNDKFGHLAGDMVLQELSNLLQNVVRTTDVVSRYGGEEFVIVLPQTDWQGAYYVAEKIREEVEMQCFTTSDIKITVSVGVAGFEDGNIIDDGLLIDQADTAFYIAKKSGRNSVVCFNELNCI